MKHITLVRTAAAFALLALSGSALAVQPEKKTEKPQPEKAPAKPAAEAPKAAEPAKPSEPAKEAPKAAEKVDANVLTFTIEDIDGAKKNLADYKGKVLLIVNTASKCGYTPQYAGLEALYQKHKSEGFEVLGFPSNDFGSQEPLNNKEIVADCQKRFGVTFPLFAKTAVKGKEANPLFLKLAKQPAPVGGEPGWNFTKFLVDRQGNVVARFDSRVKPDDVELEKRITELLKTK